MQKGLIVLLLLLASPALADVEIHFSDGTIGLVNNGRVFFGDEKGSVLFVPNEEGMMVISHEERSWVRLKVGFASAMAERMEAQIDAMLAGLPPEQQAAVKAQMEGITPTKPENMPTMSIRQTGNSAEIAGFDCDEAEIVHEDGTVEEIVCVASPGELNISDDDYAAMIRAMEGMAEIAAIGGASAPQLDFNKLGGIPIRTRAREKGGDNEVTSISTANVDASRLQIPDGYREASIGEMMGQ